MNKLMICALAALPIIGAAGCAKKNTEPAQEPLQFVNKPMINTPQRVLLKATVFRMSGDYADNVAVTLNADGSLAYYPAPTDLTENSKPLDLGGGWWLNRQGISAKSVFTKYTFEEYMKMKDAPSPAEIKAAVIPGAKVTDMQQTPYMASDAMEKLNDIREYVKTLK